MLHDIYCIYIYLYKFFCVSIGSLGANNSEGHVANVMVNNAKITDTSNGVRIKTWQVCVGNNSNNSSVLINMIIFLIW